MADEYAVAEGFDFDAIAASPRARSEGSARSDRSRREHGSSGAKARSRVEDGATSRNRGEASTNGAAARTSNGARHDQDAPAYPTNGDARRAEREAAYAKNPDQPIVRGVNGGTNGTSHPHAHMHAARKAKPVAMLLQKRRVPEPEKV